MKLHLAATFSAVTPMWMVSNGSVSAPVIMSIIFASPMRAPQRCVVEPYSARLMLSAPPATAQSVSPSRMYCEADTIACNPLPHRRLTVSAPVSCGKPAVDARDARDVHVLGLGVDHVADHALADLLRIDLRARDGFAHDLRAELARRNVLEAAAVIADGGAHAVTG